MPVNATAMRWWDSRRDPALTELCRTAVRRAELDLPDVWTAPEAVPSEFAELVSLCQQRLRNLQLDALHAIAADVEFVVVNARLVMCNEFHTADGPDTVASSRTSRARARRLALVERVWQAEQKVVTATETHVVSVQDQVKYGLAAIAHLDAAIRSAHRFSEHLDYAVPTDLQVPDDVFEIGLSRVRTALAMTPEADDNDEEGAA